MHRLHLAAFRSDLGLPVLQVLGQVLMMDARVLLRHQHGHVLVQLHQNHRAGHTTFKETVKTRREAGRGGGGGTQKNAGKKRARKK